MRQCSIEGHAITRDKVVTSAPYGVSFTGYTNTGFSDAGFSDFMHRAYYAPEIGIDEGKKANVKDDTTAYACTANKRLNAAGVPFLVTQCSRHYQQFPKLFDLNARVVTLIPNSKKQMAAVFNVAGFPLNDAQKMTKDLIDSINPRVTSQ